MTTADHAAVCELWRQHDGPASAAALDVFTRFLERNPGISPVAVITVPTRSGPVERVIGAAWCGHDGQRGSLHHVAVDPSHRMGGVGRALVAGCLEALAAARITACTAFVRGTNREAMMFWRRLGWLYENDLTALRHGIDVPAETPAG
jgi:putative acetyltransferase